MLPAGRPGQAKRGCLLPSLASSPTSDCWSRRGREKSSGVCPPSRESSPRVISSAPPPGRAIYNSLLPRLVSDPGASRCCPNWNRGLIYTAAQKLCLRQTLETHSRKRRDALSPLIRGSQRGSRHGSRRFLNFLVS